MNRTYIVAAGFALATSMAAAQVSATGTFSATPNGSNYDYTLHLTNTGSATIDVLWFAWVPDINMLGDIPTGVGSPSGWTDTVTHASAGDGYGIQWITSTSPLGLGATLNFSFTSSTTPAQMLGNSPVYPTIPITESYVYQGAPYPGFSPFAVITFSQATPEPASFAALGLGALALVRRRKTRN